ncbi:hypothetical protein [Nonomuraea sp. GTA35]|uniref:hypothetical protein n=1 Tax=Nonomuraea sp. GTA35 TaxID=1676746 RepID=UPI0035C0FAA3
MSPDIEEVTIILDAARALRAYLPELVGPDRAAPLDRELAELLERPGDEDVPDRLAAIFEREERVHVWVAEYFTYGAPGDVAETERVAPLPGVPRPPGPERYACAHGDFVFYRRRPPGCSRRVTRPGSPSSGSSPSPCGPGATRKAIWPTSTGRWRPFCSRWSRPSTRANACAAWPTPTWTGHARAAANPGTSAARSRLPNAP